MLRVLLLSAVTALALATAGGASALSGGADRAEPGAPLVVGHRGASGYRPEHTLASYALAARLGADFIEPDLVMTGDGVLVARHEPEIEDTTDVAEHPEFADRRTTRVVDGVPLEGFFVQDFTLAELKTLRAKERLPDVRQHNTLYDGLYEIPTLEEILTLREHLEAMLGRTIGVYPETKHPSFHDEQGLSLEEPLAEALRAFGLDRADAPIVVQSFEEGNLRELNGMIEAPIVRLLDDDDPADPAALATIAEYADGIGPPKGRVIPVGPDGALGEPTALVADAHAAGLLVHPYTFRNENAFLPPALRRGTADGDYGDALAEYRAFFEVGVDGLFSDNPDTAVRARARIFRLMGSAGS